MDRPDLDSRFTDQYELLRRVARRAVGSRRGDLEIRPTEIVHDCYLKLSRSEGLDTLSGPEFLALAATAIRTLLVDHARRRKALKRGEGHGRITLDGALIDHRESIDLTALDEALTALDALDARMARVVELRFFAGMSIEEVSRHLGVSASTIVSDWTMAKAWLHRELAGSYDRSA